LNTAGPGLVTRPKRWTRSGGTAVPLAPGLSVPVFPSGGLHYSITADDESHDEFDFRVKNPTAGNVAELAPTGTLVTGAIDQRRVRVLDKTGLGLAAGALIFLDDGGAKTDIAEVRSASEVRGQTRVRFVNEPSNAPRAGLRARKLGAANADENLTAT